MTEPGHDSLRSTTEFIERGLLRTVYSCARAAPCRPGLRLLRFVVDLLYDTLCNKLCTTSPRQTESLQQTHNKFYGTCPYTIEQIPTCQDVVQLVVRLVVVVTNPSSGVWASARARAPLQKHRIIICAKNGGAREALSAEVHNLSVRGDTSAKNRKK